MAVCNLACEGLSGASTTPDQAQRKLYIGGLAPDVTSEVLLNFLGRHGEIEEGSVAYDKETNESRYKTTTLYFYRDFIIISGVVFAGTKLLSLLVLLRFYRYNYCCCCCFYYFYFCFILSRSNFGVSIHSVLPVVICIFHV